MKLEELFGYCSLGKKDANFGIKDCYNIGSIKADAWDIGGIVGECLIWNKEEAQIVNCYNIGNIIKLQGNKQQLNVGGIVGSLEYSGMTFNGMNSFIPYIETLFKNCYNASHIETEETDPYFSEKRGYIFGQSHAVKRKYGDYEFSLKDCYYEDNGSIESSEDCIIGSGAIAITDYNTLLDNLNANIQDLKEELGLSNWVMGENGYPTLDFATTNTNKVENQQIIDEQITKKEIEVKNVEPIVITGSKQATPVVFKELEKGTYIIKETLVEKYNASKNQWETLTINKDYDVETTENRMINTIKNDEEKTKKGDITGDGQIDINDITAMKRHIAAQTTGKNADKWTLSEDQQKVADVTGDGVIDINDVTKIKRYIAATSDEEVAQKHPDWLNL